MEELDYSVLFRWFIGLRLANTIGPMLKGVVDI